MEKLSPHETVDLRPQSPRLSVLWRLQPVISLTHSPTAALAWQPPLRYLTRLLESLRRARWCDR